MNEAAAQEVQMIPVIDRHIEFCSGCFACMQNGGVCRHNDDMRSILDHILASDILLFSFPLYGYGMPAMLKNLIDRTLPLSSMAMHKVGDRSHVQCAGGGGRYRSKIGTCKRSRTAICHKWQD